MKTNAEKLAEAKAALVKIQERIAKFNGEGKPTSLIHEEMRLESIVDWYEQAEAERIAREKVPVA